MGGSALFWWNLGNFGNLLMTMLRRFAHPSEYWVAAMWEQPTVSQVRSREDGNWCHCWLVCFPLPPTSQPSRFLCLITAPPLPCSCCVQSHFYITLNCFAGVLMSRCGVCTMKYTAWVQTSCWYTCVLDFSLISILCWHVIGRRYSWHKQPPSGL